MVGKEISKMKLSIFFLRIKYSSWYIMHNFRKNFLNGSMKKVQVWWVEELEKDERRKKVEEGSLSNWIQW